MNRRISASKSSGARNAYCGGYSESLKRQVESVNLPSTIICKICKKRRIPGSFSKRQLEIFRHAVVTQGDRALRAGQATCRSCTGEQTMELKCLMCDKTKALYEFANNQRREHENARCLSCVQGHADAEPVVDENKLLPENEFSTTQGTVTASHAGNSIADSTRLLTLTEAPGQTGSAFADDKTTAAQSIGGDGYHEPERLDANNSRAQANLGASDALSVHNDWQSWGVVGSKAPSSVRSGGREKKFAKIPAYKGETQNDTALHAAEFTGHTVPSDDEEDEEWTL
ncbi:uncharacterized protein BJX67DRAFT_340402 [Aspergillus lucknowensis]|uniref:Stc1 domain-containing protein n=1 Tax=Aspergillus lucknowensis TaxID=176173 RepID=A0ABR4M870_9EURO